MRSEAAVREIMHDFAIRTGLIDKGQPPVRYLWTDAFAVCNFLGLYEESGDREALSLACRLVDQTHHVLGRHRSDDPREGWISGLTEREGEAHPTVGGLRIGKTLPERGVREPADFTREWDRDGQYFHYLTRWMHALARVAIVTKDYRYRRQACELARAAYAGFKRRAAGGTEHLCWKMSIDLGRPQVASTGHHDPLDAFIAYSQLQACDEGDSALDLSREIRGLARMCAGRSWDTDDALGVGGLLCDAFWLAQLDGWEIHVEARLLEGLLQSALSGIEVLVAQHSFDEVAERRLAFRELGLAIGLRAVAGIHESGGVAAGRVCDSRVAALLAELARYSALAPHLEHFWLDPSSRKSRSWTEHRNINEIMLAASLAPEGYLGPMSGLQRNGDIRE